MREPEGRHPSMARVLGLQIPLPPLPVQEEIVRILDSFTGLISELEAELAARRKQYEQYRDRLLSCEKIKSDRTTLENVAEYNTRRISISNITLENYVSVETLRQNRQGRILATEIPSGQQFIGFDVGDILLGNIRPYLKKIWFADCNGGTNGDVLVVRITKFDDVVPRFLYHVIFNPNKTII